MSTISKAIEILQEYQKSDPEQHVCMTLWMEDDVIAQSDYKVTKEQARDILDRMEDNHDATVGINWEVIDCYLEDMDEV